MVRILLGTVLGYSVGTPGSILGETLVTMDFKVLGNALLRNELSPIVGATFGVSLGDAIGYKLEHVEGRALEKHVGRLLGTEVEQMLGSFEGSTDSMHVGDAVGLDVGL